MNRTDIINAVCDHIDAKTYLEIGVRNFSDNLAKIRCDFKWGVDPATVHQNVTKCTSREYWDNNPYEWDVIFVDGSHTYEDSIDDIVEACKRAKFVVVHDCLPTCIEETGPSKPSDGSAWCGDVWKSWTQACQGRNEMVCVNTDHGVGVINTAGMMTGERPSIDIDFTHWFPQRSVLSRMCSPPVFKTWLERQ